LGRSHCISTMFTTRNATINNQAGILAFDYTRPTLSLPVYAERPFCITWWKITGAANVGARAGNFGGTSMTIEGTLRLIA
jgi:hypothetical protein